MTSFPIYRMPYIHPAKHLVMEPLTTIIDRLSAEKRLVVRHAESLSWGDRVARIRLRYRMDDCHRWSRAAALG